jgi:hypothetical protein
MTMSDERLVDFIRSLPESTPVQNNIKQRRFTTMHNRGVTPGEFYIAARFTVALIGVIVPEYKFPLLLDLGTKDIRLPVWYKDGSNGWQLADYKTFSKEAFGLPVAMMRAISRKMSIGENQILSALHSLSMISVDVLTNAKEGPRHYRQTFSGRLVNPVDGQAFNLKPVQNVEGFILDKKRVNEWIQKELQKRGQCRS